MGNIKLNDWDTSRFLKDEEDIQYYLEAVFKDGTAEEITEALDNVAKARQSMCKITKKAQGNTSNRYRSLSKDGAPLFKTVNNVVHALGFRLSIVPVQKKKRNSQTVTIGE